MAAITSFQPGGYPGRPYGSFAGRVPAATATVSGTATTGITEVEYRTSSKVILIDIANDTLEVGATFDAARAAVLAGITSTSGIFIANQVVGTVVRTSDTRITITLAADPLYDISSTDTITVIVPESVLVTSISDVLATPTFTVTAVAAAAAATQQPSGVRKSKPPVIRLSDLKPESRQNTADFLKAKLGLFDEPATQQPVIKPGKAAFKAGARSKADVERDRLAMEALRNAELEAADEIRIIRQNNEILAIILMANG